jgi:hypothetical protein
MKRFLAALVAFLLAVPVLLALAPSADAYPDTVCRVTVQPQHVVGGQSITMTGSSTVSQTWTFTFNGQTSTGQGTTFSHEFTTPAVSTSRTLDLVATCGGTDQHVPVQVGPATGTAGPAAGPTQAAAQPDHNGILPGTGGPGFWVLVAAIVLLVAGGIATTVSRRRDAR